MERSNEPPDIRRIKLTRSEPLVYLKKPNALTTARYTQQVPLVKKRHTQPPVKKDVDRKSKNPSQSVRPKVTVVSPKRKVRLSTTSSGDFSRSTADGESSPCSLDEERIFNTLKFRYPGDGCNSDSDSDTSDGDFDDDVDNYCGAQSADLFDDEEIYDDDDGATFEDDITGDDASGSTLSADEVSDEDEDESRMHSQLTTPSLSWHMSKCSLHEEAPLPLLRSLFPNKPPTLYFTTDNEKVCQLPLEIRKILKWRASSVTPKVVKSCIARTGFRITKKNTDWLGVWGKHMKPSSFKSIHTYQKVNHFPGTFHIGRKDKLWRNFCKMKIAFGKQDFNFLPQTFVLPHELSQLKKIWDESVTRNKWIIKPPASARGTGIKVIHKWSQLPKKRPLIVQKYLSKPYLINGHKFDLRIYVYVTSFDPLRIYIFEDGLVRFATSVYSSSSKSLSNKYMHLTNYSINKKNKSVYTSNNEDLKDAQKSYKWSLNALWKYFQAEGINSTKIWESIKDIAVKAILCGESNVNTLTKQNICNRSSCHELFGLDIILDSKLKPWLLEVNISPSLHSNSDLDRNIKGQLVKDIFNMTGFLIPRSLLVNVSGKSNNTDEISADRFWFEPRALSSDEKAKHTYFIQRHEDFRTRCTILDVLTPDDLLVLMETEDEFSRCGSFQRLLPTSQPKNYLKFMQTPRYYNILLDEWTKQYMRDVHRTGIGIGLLQSLAGVGIHLSNSTHVDPRHQWLLSLYGSNRSRGINSQSTMFTSLPLPMLDRRKSTHSSLLSSRSHPVKKQTIHLNRSVTVSKETRKTSESRENCYGRIGLR